MDQHPRRRNGNAREDSVLQDYRNLVEVEGEYTEGLYCQVGTPMAGLSTLLCFIFALRHHHSREERRTILPTRWRMGFQNQRSIFYSKRPATD